jgi:hypothetical protein
MERFILYSDYQNSSLYWVDIIFRNVSSYNKQEKYSHFEIPLRTSWGKYVPLYTVLKSLLNKSSLLSKCLKCILCFQYEVSNDFTTEKHMCL